MSEARTILMRAGGWLAFGLGWVGIFLPGLPTTIFWILAALAFMRTNAKMYARVVSHPRFGPSVKLFVEAGMISRRGKVLSIAAMLGFATVGALAIPPAWVKLLVLGAAASGSIWVFLLPSPEPRAEVSKLAERGQGRRIE